ncbi:MAG: pyruvate synthase [Thaumarchaeota archaeon]|nr:pyruvate synthase [Nitrososphaerota archaeon]
MDSKYKTLKDMPLEEELVPGTLLCAGCGGALLVRIFEKMLGPNAITINAAGCMTMLSVFPYTPFKSSWFYTAMASAPAAAQGVRDALDMLIEKKKVDKKDDLKVLVLTGDGAASGIGLQATSAAIHRGLDFYYLVYDNEAYSNTGFQASESSPFGSATKTTVPTDIIEGSTLQKKDLFEIWRAHRPPYVATISPAYMTDVMHKIEKSSQITGPKLFIAHSPCPPGWGIDSDKVIRVAKLAVETGIWPLKEAVNGEVRHTLIQGKRLPVEEYLKTQERFEHLFKPVRKEKIIAQLQQSVDYYWKSVTK